MRRSSPRGAAEAGITLFLFVVIALRTFGYPSFPDRSHDLGEDDGYPYYARHLDEAGTLIPEFRRLPGYPLFLVAASHLAGSHYSKAGQELQGVLSLVLLAALWLPVRRTFGPLVTVLLALMLATPNLWIRMTAFPFPDFLSAVLWGAFALLALRWAGGGSWRAQAIRGAGLIALAAAMILLKAGLSILVTIFGVGLVAAHLVVRRTWSGAAALAMRAAVLVGACVAVQAVIVGICGSGSLVFYRNAMHARIATYLPPASDTEAERIVERAKAEIAAREGQAMEDENFTNTLAVAQPAVEAVWRDRLRARPFAYLGVMLEEVRRKHYFVAASFTPFAADTTPNLARIPRRDDSPASRLYRRTGLYLPGVGLSAWATSTAVAEGALRLAVFWVPLVAGLVALIRRWPIPTLTALVTLAGYTAALAFGIFIDGRYLLPFAPLIYVAQALGLATLVTMLLEQPLSPPRAAAERL